MRSGILRRGHCISASRPPTAATLGVLYACRPGNVHGNASFPGISTGPRSIFRVVAESPDTPARVLRFGVFELDLEACELRRGGRLVAVALQPFAVLATLATRPGEIVSRDELRRELWGEQTQIDVDARLNRCLSALRRVLGDSGYMPRFVETVPRRGYRLLVPPRAKPRLMAAPSRVRATTSPEQS